MPFIKAAKADAQIMTVEPIRSKKDIKNMCDWFESKGWEKYAVILKFGCNTGLRISDILGLKVGEVYGQERIRIREQKTGKIKEFLLPPKIRKLLWQYCRNRNEDEWVFEGRDHKKLDRYQVYRRLNEAVKALKINCHIGTHTMRKTFGYHSYRQYRDITLLQIIFNHTSPEVTKRYIGITQDEIDAYYLNFDIDVDAKEFDNLKPNNSRARYQRGVSFCNSYIKSGATKHKEFAEMVIEVMNNDSYIKDCGEEWVE